MSYIKLVAGNSLNQTMENARLYSGCPVSIGTPPYSCDCWKDFKHEGPHKCDPPQGGGCGREWPNTGLKDLPTKVPKSDGLGFKPATKPQKESEAA